MITPKMQKKVTRVPKGSVTYEEAIRRAKAYVLGDSKQIMAALENDHSDVVVLYMGNDIYSINVRIGMNTEIIYTILDKSFKIQEEPKEFKSIW